VSFFLSVSGAGDIVKHHPRLNLLYEMKRPDQTLLKFIKTVRRIKPEIAFVATGTNPLKSGLVSLLAGARFRIGERFGAGRILYNVTVPYRFHQHEIANNVQMAKAMGCNATVAPSCTIWSTQTDADFALKFMSGVHGRAERRFIGIHPGSGENMQFKRWNLDRFTEVSRRIVRLYDVKILVFGGKDESGLGTAFRDALGNDAVLCAGATTILQSFELMKHCILFLSNDSSPLHMAAVAGIPVVAIFGPTSDVRTGPSGMHCRSVIHPVPCRPCYPATRQRSGLFNCHNSDRFACLTHITVESVLTQIDSLLKETGRA
jgi:ADP-heptose:LPS heptosyltransferase